MKKTKTKKEKVVLEKTSSSFYLYLIIIFLVVQTLGIITANYYASLQDLRITLITDNPNDIINAIFLIFQILIITGLILLIKRFSKKTGYLKIFEYLALFFGITIVFDVFLYSTIAMYLSIILLMIKYVLEHKNLKSNLFLWYNNLLLAISIAGAGAIIGLSLGLIPVLTFLILLSIYDIIAVFYTKHMITLAKTFSKKRMSLIFYIPTKKKLFQLGGGDLVIPLVVSSSFFFYLLNTGRSIMNAMIPIFILWVVSLLGLFITFYILRVKKLKAMPALPLQALFMIIVVILTITF
jgi:presenilin-like A22 family membrane protease